MLTLYDLLHRHAWICTGYNFEVYWEYYMYILFFGIYIFFIFLVYLLRKKCFIFHFIIINIVVIWKIYKGNKIEYNVICFGLAFWLRTYKWTQCHMVWFGVLVENLCSWATVFDFILISEFNHEAQF